ncbi:Uncharacterized protein HZ326_1852 [Fusarium oxysporum f. sp. albedinis]|nr:Uncharacterized protein HZ326_1852 [Fusarium oxysporum f. sp. albedinis]
MQFNPTGLFPSNSFHVIQLRDSALLQAATTENLQENLHKKGPAFAVYDFGESYGHKIAFISWTPGDATARTKMIYGSARDTVRQSLDNLSLDINAYDAGDIDKGGVLRLLD